MRARAGAFVEPIDAYDVELLPEIEGIAEGAGVDAEDVLAINLRTEIMFGLGGRSAPGGLRECTALCSTGGGVGWHAPVLAQNWDWKPAVREHCVVLAAAPHGRPGFVTVVEAGLLAKCGVNEAGLALATNALISTLDRGAPGVPYHAVLRRILTSSSVDEAIAAVRVGPRASSANYLIADDAGRAVDLEAVPGGPSEVRAFEGQALGHANHFLWPAPRPFKDVGRIDGEDSVRRQARVDGSLGEIAGSSDPSPDARGERIRAALADHDGRPSSVCAHEDPTVPPIEDFVTVISMIAEPASRILWVTDGNPCERPYERLDVADLLDRAGRALSGPARSGTP